MADLAIKPQMPLAERLVLLDKASETINKKYGKKIVGRIGADPELMKRLEFEFVPTASAALNDAIGGGFPKRRCTIIAGQPGSGKTSLLLETIAKNMEKSDFVAVWLESEKSQKKSYLDMFRIDPERFFYIDATAIENAEIVLDNLYGILGTGAADICCINSLKCLIPKAEMDASFSEQTVALKARLNSRMSDKFLKLVAEMNTAFVIVTHLTTDIGVRYGDNQTVSGGMAIRYWSSLTLDLRQKAVLDSDPIDRSEGMKIGVTVKKNRCVPERNPYVKLDYFVIYGEGIETTMSTLALAIDKGICEAKGAWIYWPDKQNGEIKQKWNGRAAYREFMKEHPEALQELLNEIGGQEAISTIEELSKEEVAAIEEEEAKIFEDKKTKRKKEITT